MTILNHDIPIPLPLIIFTLFTLLLQPTKAQPNSPPDSLNGQNFSPSMGVIIIVLIAALFFMGFFSIYIRHCANDTTTATGRRVGTGGAVARSRRAPRGLDDAVIASFPTFNYADVKTLKIGKGALECAVCLTEFDDEDELKLLPKCDHVFHPECIDPWLAGHVTCPVCRANLVPDPEDEGEFTLPGLATENDINNDHVIDVDQSNNIDQNSMEEPLNGNNINSNPHHSRRLSRTKTMRKLLGRLARSVSTGQVEVKQWENYERFTLRLPEEVRKQVINMSGKLERATSLVVLPRETSSRRGYRTSGIIANNNGGGGGGLGEGSSRGPRSKSDRWGFGSLLRAPSFLFRSPSMKSPRVTTTSTNGTSREGSLRGTNSIREQLSQIPV